MSEQPKEKLEEERPKTPTEVIASLADRFPKGEMPMSLEELQEQEADTGKAWEEDGFSRVTTYLDEEGNVVMVAPSAENKRDPAFSKIKTEKTWRLFVDGEVITVTVPPELQGPNANFRSSRGFNSIYRLSDNEEPQLTDGMQRLVDKFGSTLSTGHDQGEGTLGSMVALYSVASLIKMNEQKAHQEEQQQKYGEEEAEAWRIHEAANHASAKVRRDFFMKATIHEGLQERVYKDEVNRQLNNPDKPS